MARVITVTSGKGGVGKTNISVNLSLHLAERGYRVCLFDADLGLANVNILLGLYPEYNLEDVISKRMELNEIIIRDKGLDIIPGSSGVERMADLEPPQVEHLLQSFARLVGYDFFICDTSAGISRNVVSFCMASSEVVLVVTPEPTSLTDGYALLKVLSINGYEGHVKVVLNFCRDIHISTSVFTKFRNVVQKYLPVELFPVGTLLLDPHVTEAVKRQKPFISLYPNSDASKCIKNIARTLLDEKAPRSDINGLEGFWTRCLDAFRGPLKLDGTRKKGAEASDSTPVAKENKTEEGGGPGEGSALPPNAGGFSAPSIESEQPEPTQGDSMLPDMRQLLGALSVNISHISRDIGAIRRAIERGRGIQFPEESSLKKVM
ncbi:MAG: MinD/ParA family protein [Pseudomonadota bacterium]